MGYIAEPTPEMGEYSVEIRSESFYLRGEYNIQQKPPIKCPGSCTVIGEHMHSGGIECVVRRHGIFLYPAETGFRQGTVEILIEDIPKIRAALDQVERVASSKSLPTD